MELFPEERRRIYEQEKAELAAKGEAKRKRIAKVGCLLCLGVVAVACIFGWLVSDHSKPGNGAKRGPVSSLTQEFPQDGYFAKMTSPEHLTEARKSLDFWQSGRLDYARRHLDAIKPNTPEWREAERLKSEVERLEAKRAKALDMAIEQSMVSQREAFAVKCEEIYLDKGWDVHVRLSGPSKTTFRMEYVLLSRPMVYQITNKSTFLNDLRNLGFKKGHI